MIWDWFREKVRHAEYERPSACNMLLRQRQNQAALAWVNRRERARERAEELLDLLQALTNSIAEDGISPPEESDTPGLMEAASDLIGEIEGYVRLAAPTRDGLKAPGQHGREASRAN